MNITNKIKSSLKREYILCSNAAAFYKKGSENLSKNIIQHPNLSKRFEAGQIGMREITLIGMPLQNSLSSGKTQSALPLRCPMILRFVENIEKIISIYQIK